MRRSLSLLFLFVLLVGGYASARGEQGQLYVAKTRTPLLGDKPSPKCVNLTGGNLTKCVDRSSHDKVRDDSWGDITHCMHLVGLYLQCELGELAVAQEHIRDLQRQARQEEQTQTGGEAIAAVVIGILVWLLKSLVDWIVLLLITYIAFKSCESELRKIVKKWLGQEEK